MRTPKLLPWIARKQGISDALALQLWRRACSELGNLIDLEESPQCSGLALHYFLDLVASENHRRRILMSPQTVFALLADKAMRQQRRLCMLSAIRAEQAARLWRNAFFALSGNSRRLCAD